MEVKGFVEIVRPANCIIAGLVGILGATVALGSLPPSKTSLLIFLVVFLGCSWGNTINDYFDYEIDKINRPKRPLPRGAFSRNTALIYGLSLALSGLFIAYLIGIEAFLFALGAYLLMFLYAWKLKPLPLIGNLAVATLTGATPIYGAIAVEKIGLAGYLALCAFLVNVAREIFKDVEDIEGDKTQGAKTLPIIWGVKKASMIGVLFNITTIMASFLPVRVGIGLGYFPIIFVDGIILWASYEVLKSPAPTTAGKVQRKLKIAIYLAVLSFLLGSITREV
ncbi:geranylgeranylglycerol-phosphate geranylgeranyltransferase [Thermococcus sp. MV5]|uniref:geranylgeranylglycerol-phosphate geranylgeranyltransferase n=1 Tax=Thermococcus sp. MV5 TaxID=1638272 RepID=UPI0014390618|nr:geranylgeranylglycerol-phosphate geranylgeranyltransferase [Thermococcus sp. MV5]NJE25087.1 geranylgeranylglycerol-phosphate geranylgeranyltransferase [Thermococcus sp. MV5]